MLNLWKGRRCRLQYLSKVCVVALCLLLNDIAYFKKYTQRKLNLTDLKIVHVQKILERGRKIITLIFFLLSCTWNDIAYIYVRLYLSFAIVRMDFFSNLTWLLCKNSFLLCFEKWVWGVIFQGCQSKVKSKNMKVLFFIKVSEKYEIVFEFNDSRHISQFKISSMLKGYDLVEKMSSCLLFLLFLHLMNIHCHF